ncbi:MAG TPA: bifunctional folylpolyglutamate synthase/dihydrofolate synthase [Clostridiaceae bacterium]|nr:bifunctional folylpolyglutamate synthase/dihydrofolate synthase [Clostridiaceae bacterium]
MDYQEALNYIHGTHKFGSKLGLKNITRLLELMGNPQRKLKYVHVAGTNGKGSTSAFISSILIESGYKVGIFTSPYLERFTERIKVNDEEIKEEDIARLTGLIKANVEKMLAEGENHPTEFEIITAMAFQYFAEVNCDIVVLEVGLGGRFDSTNVIDKPEVAVITTINYDHMDRLGNTLPEIAFEKAGIIKNDCDVVIYPQVEDVREVFEKVCKDKNARLHWVDFSGISSIEFGADGQAFNYKDYGNVKISLIGSHQINNAIVAIKTAEVLRDKGFAINQQSILKGLIKARWPGRLEIVNREPLFLIDGAHNIEGAKALHDALNLYFPDRRKIFIIGVLKDKKYREMIEAVSPIADRFITVTPNSDRALEAEETAEIIRFYCSNVTASPTIKEAIEKSLREAEPGDVICAFGSLYYIGEVRNYFKNNK